MNSSRAQHGDLIAVTGQLGCLIEKKVTSDKSLESNNIDHFLPSSLIQKIQSFANISSDNSKGLMSSLRGVCQVSHVGAKISLEQLPVNQQLKNDSPEWSSLALFTGNVDQICFTFTVNNLFKLPDNCTVIGQMGCGDQVRVFSNNQEVSIKDNQGVLHCKTVD